MAELSNYLKSGQRIFVAGSVNEPTALVNELSQQPLPADLEFVQFPLGGYNRMDFTALDETSRVTTFFMTSHLKDADPARLNFLPKQMRRVFDYLSKDIDVAMLQAAYDAAG